MFRLTPILILLVVSVIAADACRTQYCPSGGCTQHWFRRKRATPDTLENALTVFDVQLTEELSRDINDMTAEEKQTFLNDLGKLNEAVKMEIIFLDKNIQGNDNLLQQLSFKVTQDFSGKKWFKRLRSIAGEKIARLINHEA